MSNDRCAKEHGLRFEGQVRDALGGLGCGIRFNDELDENEKTDILFTCFPRERRLRVPYSIQLTFKRDHLGKLMGFQRARIGKRFNVSVYVEIERGTPYTDAARLILQSLSELHLLFPDEQRPFWIFLTTRRGGMITTDLEKHISELRRIKEERLTSSSRSAGTIIECQPNGFKILGADERLYFAYDHNVANGSLLKLRNGRESLRPPIQVTFFQTGNGVPFENADTVVLAS